MPVRFQHDQQPISFYFVTFTCYKWLSLFQEANAYDAVYKWFIRPPGVFIAGPCVWRDPGNYYADVD